MRNPAPRVCACGCGAVLPPPHPMAHGSRKFLTKTCATRYYHHAIRNPARTRVRKEARLMKVLAEWDASPELVALVRGWLGLDLPSAVSYGAPSEESHA